jgi:hypothetical protein
MIMMIIVIITATIVTIIINNNDNARLSMTLSQSYAVIAHVSTIYWLSE